MRVPLWSHEPTRSLGTEPFAAGGALPESCAHAVSSDEHFDCRHVLSLHAFFATQLFSWFAFACASDEPFAMQASTHASSLFAHPPTQSRISLQLTPDA